MNLVIFQDSLGKDADNFIRGTQSVNNNQPTKLQEEYELLFGKDFFLEKVEKFLKERAVKLDLKFQQRASTFAKEWQHVEGAFISRCEELFSIRLEGPIIAFLSQNQRCTYRWREGYFYIYYDSQTPNKTVMHELLHFYTHRKYESLKIESKKFNDIKESLTVLLNTDFVSLTGKDQDTGYPQHQKMRAEIKELRQKGLSVDEIVHVLAQI